jgi:phospholipase D-like protein
MADPFEVEGNNAAAPFTLKIRRGESMSLLAMNWLGGEPPPEFVGFAIEYQEPGGKKFYKLNNRLSFTTPDGKVDRQKNPTTTSPIQMFRWVHFPFHAELEGEFHYRVTPVFMDAADRLSYGDPQEVGIVLGRETYPGKLNVGFTRGFVSSQAFVDRYAKFGPIDTLVPTVAADGLDFTPTHPKTADALQWMGFEARSEILELLDAAIADPTAQVRVVAFDLNEPNVVSRLEQLGHRVHVIIDDSKSHAGGSAENKAETLLDGTAGIPNVKRQHMGNLQHNKFVVVDGGTVQAVVCGSTNFSWRGMYVQNNNAIVLRGDAPVQLFKSAFDEYWQTDDPKVFGVKPPATSTPLGLDGIDASVAFSPHSADNALLATIAKDIGDHTTQSLFYSLAFLYETPGVVKDAVKKVIADDQIFVYGISDKRVGGLDLNDANGKRSPVFPAELAANLPEPFSAEPSGLAEQNGKKSGTRMHHKFVVIDFDRPAKARVYTGSYNFSKAADNDNGENLLLIKDQRIAVAYTIEALRIFDHYSFRVLQQDAATAQKQLFLARPPRQPNDVAWWKKYYTDVPRIRDRELFA